VSTALERLNECLSISRAHKVDFTECSTADLSELIRAFESQAAAVDGAVKELATLRERCEAALRERDDLKAERDDLTRRLDGLLDERRLVALELGCGLQVPLPGRLADVAKHYVEQARAGEARDRELTRKLHARVEALEGALRGLLTTQPGTSDERNVAIARAEAALSATPPKPAPRPATEALRVAREALATIAIALSPPLVESGVSEARSVAATAYELLRAHVEPTPLETAVQAATEAAPVPTSAQPELAATESGPTASDCDEEAPCVWVRDADDAAHLVTACSVHSANHAPVVVQPATEAQLDATLRDAGVAAVARAKGYDEGLEAAAALVEEGAGTPVGADLRIVRSDELAAKLRAKKVGA